MQRFRPALITSLISLASVMTLIANMTSIHAQTNPKRAHKLKADRQAQGVNYLPGGNVHIGLCNCHHNIPPPGYMKDHAHQSGP